MYKVKYNKGLYVKAFKSYNEAIIFQNSLVNAGDFSAVILSF